MADPTPSEKGAPQKGEAVGAGGDPSMEDILASIRRILNEEQGAPPAPGDRDDVLVLESDMLAPGQGPSAAPVLETFPPEPVSAPEAAAPAPEDMSPAPEPPAALLAGITNPEPAPMSQNSAPEPPAPPEPPVPGPETPALLAAAFSQALMAPETEDAASVPIRTLAQTLASSRDTQVYRGGPTIEELVREEVRPLLKAWLDTNLPPLVERIVRAEIERLHGRIGF